MTERTCECKLAAVVPEDGHYPSVPRVLEQANMGRGQGKALEFGLAREVPTALTKFGRHTEQILQHTKITLYC